MGGLIEWLGVPALLTAGDALIGLGFGFFAQRSAFCLRAAVIEFWRGEPGQKLAVWLLAFSAAVVGVQALILSGAMDVTARANWPPAAVFPAHWRRIGAVLMGFGAMLAGGCAVTAGLSGGSVFAVTAWLTLVGMWTGAGLTDRWLDRRPAEVERSAGVNAAADAWIGH